MGVLVVRIATTRLQACTFTSTDYVGANLSSYFILQSPPVVKGVPVKA